MDSCRLPIELCEYIVEFVAALSCWSRSRTVDEQRTLSSCALTCRAWRTRAQHLLWQSPHFPNSIQLSRFVDHLHTGAPKGSKLLPITISLGRYYSSSDRMQLPPGLLMLAFPNLRSLSCDSLRLDASPRLLRVGLPFFSGITSLRLTYCAFSSARAMLDVTWAFPDLSSLNIEQCHVRKAPTAVECARLPVICEHRRACRELSNLHFDCVASLPDAPSPLLGSAFGSSITQLDIVIDYTQTLAAFLAGSFPALSALNVMSTPTLDERSHTEGPSWLRAIASNLTAPGNIRSIRLCRRHGSDSGHQCCRDLMEDRGADSAATPLGDVLSGVEKLLIALYKCDAPEECAAHIWGALPGMHSVLRFERQGPEGGVWIELPFNPT